MAHITFLDETMRDGQQSRVGDADAGGHGPAGRADHRQDRL